MLVRDLIEKLSTLPPDSEVILQKDPEGNGFHEVRAVDGDAVYCADDDIVYCATWTADEACMSQDEWAEILAKPRCVVLAP